MIFKRIVLAIGLIVCFGMMTNVDARASNASNKPQSQGAISQKPLQFDAMMFLIRNLDITTLPATTGPIHEAGKKTLRDYGFRLLERSIRDSTVTNGDTRFYFEIYTYDPAFRWPWEICVTARSEKKKIEWTRPYQIVRQDSGVLVRAKPSQDLGECQNSPERSVKD